MHKNLATRRRFLQTSGAALMGAGLVELADQSLVKAAETPALKLKGLSLSAGQALDRLLAGNARFVKGKQLWPDQAPARRTVVAAKQQPIAIVFGCVDSRVPAELVFDQGLGDIFDIRTAAHVIDHAALGSLEYGVAELHIPLLIVLGHERCGAVSATITAVDTHKDPPGSIKALTDYIRPAVLAAHGTGATRLDNAVRINTQRTVNALHSSAILKSAIESNKLAILGARYDLDTGVVGIFTQ